MCWRLSNVSSRFRFLCTQNVNKPAIFCALNARKSTDGANSGEMNPRWISWSLREHFGVRKGEYFPHTMMMLSSCANVGINPNRAAYLLIFLAFFQTKFSSASPHQPFGFCTLTDISFVCIFHAMKAWSNKFTRVSVRSNIHTTPFISSFYLKNKILNDDVFE